MRLERELLPVRGHELSRQRTPGGIAVVIGTIGELHHEVESLAEESAVGEATHLCRLELQSRVGHHTACFVFETLEGGFERSDVATVEADAHGRHTIDARR